MSWNEIFDEITTRLKIVVDDNDPVEKVLEDLVTVFNDVVYESLYDDMAREWRCTRRHPYRDPDCAGHGNPRARQGHYIRARDQDHARRLMAVRFPDDEVFDVELWKEAS